MLERIKEISGWRPKKGASTILFFLVAFIVVVLASYFLASLIEPDEATINPILATLAVVIAIVGLLGALVFPETFRAMSYVFASGEAAALFASAPVRIDEIDFYSMAAQITPVLLLAVAFEVRSYQQRRLDDLDRMNLFMVMLFLLVAGVESMRVLALGEAQLGLASPVIAGLGGATLQLAMLAIIGPREADLSEDQMAEPDNPDID